MIRGFRCERCNHVAWDDTETSGWSCPKCIGKMYHDVDVPFGTLDPYVWPGGYPIHYYPRSRTGLVGDELCAKCTEKLRDVGEFPYGLAQDTYLEGPEVNCEECGKIMPSAYGDPDGDDE